MWKLVFGVTVVAAAVTCAVAAAAVSKRVKSRRKWMKVIGVLWELEESCETSVSRLKQVVDAMAVAGLASEGGSKLRMLLTFVDKLPTWLAHASGLVRGEYIMHYILEVLILGCCGFS